MDGTLGRAASGLRTGSHHPARETPKDPAPVAGAGSLPSRRTFSASERRGGPALHAATGTVQPMRNIVLLLTLLGPGLTVLSLGVGYFRVKRELTRLRGVRTGGLADRRAVEQLPRNEQEAARARADALYPSSSSGNDVLYLREVIAELILESSGQPLRLPAVLAGLGLVFGTTASAWSLYLPCP